MGAHRPRSDPTEYKKGEKLCDNLRVRRSG